MSAARTSTRTARKFISILVLVSAVSAVMGPAYWLVVRPLSHEGALVVAYIMVPLALAWLVHRSGYFADFGYTATERRLFQPYFAASRSDQARVIVAISLLGLLPVAITVLLLPDFDAPWFDALPFGLVALTYLSTVLIYSGIFFERVRRRLKGTIAPASIILTGVLSGYGSHYATNALDLAGWSLILLSVAITAYGAALLLQAAQRIADRKSRVEAEVTFASEVQRQFLQSRTVAAGVTAGFALSKPARQLGGDFFHIESRGDRLLAAVGDVSGHSFGAGLIMTMLKTSFENLVAFGLPLRTVFSTLNDQVASRTSRSVFATLGCVDLNPESGECMLWNAGHMPVLHYREKDRSIDTVHTPGLGLGLRRESDFCPKAFRVEPDDWLVLYSDGLAETRDEKGSIRSSSFLIEVVRDALSRHEKPEAAAKAIMRIIGDAHRNDSMGDDATLVVLRFGTKDQPDSYTEADGGRLVEQMIRKDPCLNISA